MNEKQIHYIAGSAGGWELIQYAIEQKKKNPIAKFNDIIDIEITSSGYVFENKAGLWAAEYGKDKIRIPFRYRLFGKYRDRILLNFKDNCMIIDMKKMFIGLEKVKKQAPELFKTPSTIN